MPKFPRPPSADALREISPEVRTLPKGTTLARVYFTGGAHPVAWNAFRHFGPTNGRFDHHLATRDGAATVQSRSVFYCARSALTCLAEVFQHTRRIDRVRHAPCLVVFELQRSLRLLNLTRRFPTKVGASMAINTGSRVRAREWAHAFYEAYEDLHGLYYASSMHANEPAIVLTDRAETLNAMPAYPVFNRALNDDALVSVLKHAASALNYALR